MWAMCEHAGVCAVQGLQQMPERELRDICPGACTAKECAGWDGSTPYTLHCLCLVGIVSRP